MIPETVPAWLDAAPMPSGPEDYGRATELSMLDLALGYARQGWPVFPCGIDKKPLTAHGLKDATTAPDRIRVWWGRHPEAGIGLPTGEATGFFALDCDNPEAEAAVAARGIPSTVSIRTGRGIHLYYKLPAGEKIGNRAGLLPGVDIRGEGGYVIAAGSRHASGRRYEYINDPDFTDIADAPAWLLEMLCPARGAPPALLLARSAHILPGRVDAGGNWAAAALNSELAKLKSASVGTRNDQLFRSAAALAEICAGGSLGWDRVVAELRAAALAIGLEGPEIARTLESAWAAGSQNPRRPSEAPRAASGGEPDNDRWPEPEPLPGLPSVAAFDFDLLPTSLRPWIEDMAERVQCAPDFPAVAAMVAFGAVVGGKIGIRPKRQDDWVELANLWGCIIGRPGVMKSPALSEAMKPLRRLEVRALEAHEIEHCDWEARHSIAELRKQAWKRNAVKDLCKGKEVGAAEKDVDDPEPQTKRYVVNDSSVEALGEILRANPNGVLAYRDELVSLLKSLDREGNEGARGFYLAAWAGKEGYTFDRIGRGLNLRIDACCLSLLGSTQPAAIGSYLAEAVETGGGDGLLSRFGMMVWPDVSGEWRNVDRRPDSTAKNAAFATFERLDALDGSVIGQTDEDGSLPFLRFDGDAQGIFDEWRANLETRLRSGDDHPALESHLAKYRKLVPALALLSHLADDAGAAVGEVAVLKALGWVEYLETHARRAYAAVTAADTTAARALWRRICKGDVADGFTERDIYKRDWSGLGRQEVARGVTTLEGHGYLRAELAGVGEAGGRPKTIWRINPRGLP